MEDKGLLYSKLATFLQLSEGTSPKPHHTDSQNCKSHASVFRAAISKEFLAQVCGKKEKGLKQIEIASGIHPIVKWNQSELWLQGRDSEVRKAIKVIEERLKSIDGQKVEVFGSWNCCGRDLQKEGRTKRQGKVFALDCEIVLTSRGREVARVALLDFSGETCLDELVKPENQIWNYNTKDSGITKDTLRGVRTRLSDVQQSLKSLVSADDILVGHSLDTDLKCLDWMHEKVAKMICPKIIFFRRLPTPALPFQILMEARRNCP